MQYDFHKPLSQVVLSANSINDSRDSLTTDTYMDIKGLCGNMSFTNSLMLQLWMPGSARGTEKVLPK